MKQIIVLLSGFLACFLFGCSSYTIYYIPQNSQEEGLPVDHIIDNSKLPRPQFHTPRSQESVTDPEDDFTVSQQLFEEDFQIKYNKAVIPASMDIRNGTMGYKNDFYIFTVSTSSSNLQTHMDSNSEICSFTLFVDIDHDGKTDILVTCDGHSKQVKYTDNQYNSVATDLPYRIFNNNIAIPVLRELIGDNFQWIISSGYSPNNIRYYQTQADDIHFVPGVDYLIGSQSNSQWSDWIEICGERGKRIVVEREAHHCMPNEQERKHLGPNIKPKGWDASGWEYKIIDWTNGGYELWCACDTNTCQYGVRVINKDIKEGAVWWVAKCPFKGGFNVTYEVCQTNVHDNIYRLTHTVYDMGDDDDKDDSLDVMIYDYNFKSDDFYIALRQYDYNTLRLGPIYGRTMKGGYLSPVDIPEPEDIQAFQGIPFWSKVFFITKDELRNDQKDKNASDIIKPGAILQWWSPRTVKVINTKKSGNGVIFNIEGSNTRYFGGVRNGGIQVWKYLK